MATINEYPNIRKAYLEMSYDNGGINRDRTEEKAIEDSESVMGSSGVYHEDLIRLDEWIGTLTEDQIKIMIAGEEIEMKELCSQAPTGGPDNLSLTNIFYDLFEVC